MAGAGARAGAEIMDKRGAKKEPEPKINNFGSATLLSNQRYRDRSGGGQIILDRSQNTPFRSRLHGFGMFFYVSAI